MALQDWDPVKNGFVPCYVESISSIQKIIKSESPLFTTWYELGRGNEKC
jgi:hypothetical protein